GCLQGPSRRLAAEPILAGLEKWFHLQTLVPGRQKQADQADPQGSYKDGQTLLEPPKRLIVALTKVDRFIERCLGSVPSRLHRNWTRAAPPLMLTFHGAFSKLSIDSQQ